MKYLFVDDFLGPEAWKPVGAALPPDAEAEYLVPAQPRTFDSGVIALAALTKLKTDFDGQTFDVVVAARGTCGPAACATLDGMARHAVLVDPNIAALWPRSVAIEQYLSNAPGEVLESMGDITDPQVEQMSQGNPGPGLETWLGPHVKDATDRWLLDRAIQISEQRMPFDESLLGSAGEEGRRASDWLTPWIEHPSQVHVILSRPDPLVLEGLQELAPGAEPLLMDWRNQMWLYEPAAVAETLARLDLNAFGS